MLNTQFIIYKDRLVPNNEVNGYYLFNIKPGPTRERLFRLEYGANYKCTVSHSGTMVTRRYFTALCRPSRRVRAIRDSYLRSMPIPVAASYYEPIYNQRRERMSLFKILRMHG